MFGTEPSEAATYPVPSGCAVGSLSAADFTNDHKLDLLAICQFTSQILVYPGLADGAFGLPVATKLPALAFEGTLFLEAASAGIGGTAADFNGDGKLDLLILLTRDLSGLASPVINAYFLPGNGDGSFGQAVQVQRGVAAVALASADFNGDGKPDYAYLTLTISENADGDQTASQTLNIQFGNGDGSFRCGPLIVDRCSVRSFRCRCERRWFCRPDLLRPQSHQSERSAAGVSNYGDARRRKGELQASVHGQRFRRRLGVSFCLADLSGSGRLDLLETFADVSIDQKSVGISIGVRAGNGDGSFQNLQKFAGPQDEFPFASVCADLNGDGLTDVAYTGISFPVIASLIGGTGGFQGFAAALALLPAGTLYLALNGTPRMLTFDNVNGASFAKGPVATNSIVSAFWKGPAKPSGIGVNVTDAAGTTRPAQIFFMSSKQINYAIPDGTTTGMATITITGTQDTFTAQQQITAVAPGVFDVNGLAVGSTLTVHNGQQTPGNLVQPDSSGTLQPVPVDVGTGSDQVFLILYGTGIRNHAQPVTATIGTTPAQVVFAAAQGAFVDEDQINVLVPQSLRGAGRVNLILKVDGQTTNPVAIQIQ